MGKKLKRYQLKNQCLFDTIYDRFRDLAVSRFEWEGLPDTVDARYIEYTLFHQGTLSFFRDPEIGELCLPYTFSKSFDIYGNPVGVNAYSQYTNYHYEPSEYVVLWDNMIRRPPKMILSEMAGRVADIMLSSVINAKAQKTPIVILADDKTRMSMEELYQEYEGNAPVIITNKGLNPEAFKVLKTDAPYVAGELMILYQAIWNEGLTYLGIPNVSYTSGSRKVADEVLRSQGGTIASRFSPEITRQQAVEKINKMFGLNVSVKFKADFDSIYLHMPIEAGEHIGEGEGEGRIE